MCARIMYAGGVYGSYCMKWPREDWALGYDVMVSDDAFIFLFTSTGYVEQVIMTQYLYCKINYIISI